MSAGLFGLIYIAIGVALLVWGARIAQLIIGLWALGIGLWLGQSIAQGNHLNEIWSFIIVWGIGVVALILAYSFYRAALAILVGFTAFWVLTAILSMFRLDSLLVLILSAVIGLLVGAYTIRSELSYLILMIISSIIGAGYTISGVLILVNASNIAQINYGPLEFVFKQPTLWVVAMLALTVVGLIIQDGPRKNNIATQS